MNDNCTPLFELGAGYEAGRKMYDDVSKGIKGRVACHRDACGVIGEVVSRCRGDHVEIGALYGGTAIIAARMKKTGLVYTIDPLNGYYGINHDPVSSLVPSRELLEKNLRHWKVENKVIVMAAKSHPWPLPNELIFDSALIDGDHTYAGAWFDWCNLRERVNRFVIFDNLDIQHPGVISAFRNACRDENWKPVLIHDICAVMERMA